MDRTDPVTTIEKAMRQLYEQYGAAAVLANEKYLINGLGDLARIDYTPKLRSQLSLAMDSGLGRLYLEQIERGKPDADFERRALNLLTQQAGLSEAAAKEITGYFNEMLGWTSGNRQIPPTPPSPPEPPVPPKPPVPSPKKSHKGIVVGIIAGVLAAIGAACCILFFSGGNGTGKSDNESKQSESVSVQSNTKSNSEYQTAESSEISNINDIQQPSKSQNSATQDNDLNNILMSLYYDYANELKTASIDYKNDTLSSIKQNLENLGWSVDMLDDHSVWGRLRGGSLNEIIHMVDVNHYSSGEGGFVSFSVVNTFDSINSNILNGVFPDIVLKTLGRKSLNDLIAPYKIQNIKETSMADKSTISVNYSEENNSLSIEVDSGKSIYFTTEDGHEEISFILIFW